MCEASYTPRTIPQAIWPRSETVAHVRSPAFPSRLCFVFPSLTWSALPTPPGSCSHRHPLSFPEHLSHRAVPHRLHNPRAPGPPASSSPCAYRLCHPNVVPMETAEPSD